MRSTVGLVLALAVLVPRPAQASTITLTVAGTSNIWLAGAPIGTTAAFSDIAPLQSPVEVLGLDFSYGVVTFAVTGLVSNGSCCPLVGPDGGTAYTSHWVGAQNGISDIVAPENSLIAVFLDDNVPVGPTPTRLDFSTLGLGFPSLAPSLQQVFFVGDGSSGAALQTFFVPTGATRLFLGTLDAFDNNNNLGSFVVAASDGAPPPTVVPEPSTLLLLGTGMAGAIARRRKRRR